MRHASLLWLLPVLMSCATQRPSSSPVASGAYARWPVLLVEDVEGLALFRDEQREAAAALATWARARGIAVADPHKTGEIVARARRGEDPRSGARCGEPLEGTDAYERWSSLFGAAGRLSASVACDDGKKDCTLSVSATGRLDGYAPTLGEWSGPIDPHAPFGAALNSALAQAKPVREGEGGALSGALGGLMGGVPRVEPERVVVSTGAARAGDADAPFADALSLPDPLAALSACFTDDDSASLLVAADASGRITRCESQRTDTAAAACVCSALEKQGVIAASARGKRFVAYVQHYAADVVTSGNTAVVHASTNTYIDTVPQPDGEPRVRTVVSDRAISTWRPPANHRLAACFTAAPPGALHFRVRTTFDASGTAVSADVQRTTGEDATDPMVKCVARAFLSSRAACPSTPSPTADADVSVVVIPLQSTGK